MSGGHLLLAGVSSPSGHALLEALERSDVRVGEITLLDPPPAGLLTRFRDEPTLARPIPESDDEIDVLLSDVDLAVLCGRTDEMASLQRRCSANGILTVSLAAPAHDDLAGPLVFLPDGRIERDLKGPLLYAPSVATAAALRILIALRAAWPPRRVVGTVLLPAAHESNEAPQALFDQSMALFNMQDLPRDILTERRAFNLLPRRPDAAAEGVLAEALGLEPDAVSLAVLAAPVFHGYGLSLWWEPGEGAEAPDEERARTLLEEAEIELAEGEAAGSHDTVDAGTMRVTLPRATGGGLWTWAAFEPASSGSITNALALTRVLLEGGSSHESS